MIHPSAIVDRGAEVFPEVEIGPYAVIGPKVVLRRGVRVGAHAVIEGPCDLGEASRLFPHAVLGSAPQDLKYRGESPSGLIVGSGCILREFTTVNRGSPAGDGTTRIGANGCLMANAHVAHDCRLGEGVVMANSVALAGHVAVGEHVWIGGLAGVHQFVRLGAHAFIGAGAMVRFDVPPFVTARGDRAFLDGLNLVGLKRHGFAEERIAVIAETYRLIARLGVEEALKELDRHPDPHGDVARIVSFYGDTRLGVTAFRPGR